MPTLDDSPLHEVLYSHCVTCEHFDSTVGVREKKRCAAFPDGIPDEIWRGDNDHSVPYPGDHGIRFEEVAAGGRRR